MFKENSYEDDNPILSLPGDDDGNDEIHSSENEINQSEETRSGVAGEDDEDVEVEDRSQYGTKKFKTCPHYRQLTNKQLSKNLHSTFIPNVSKVSCCSVGGDKSKFGAHDIEDLVSFGVQPHVKKGIALYRDQVSGEKSFGMTLCQERKGSGNIFMKHMKPNGAADREGSLNVGDTILSVNGSKVLPRNPLSTVTTKIKESRDPLVVDVYSGDNDEIDTNEYSSHAACPYYISRALAKNADLIFCPYNYILDPDIRNAMELDVEDSIVVLDEAHNVEDALRGLGSATFGEFELIEMMALLNAFAVKWIPPHQRISQYSRRKREEDLSEKMPDIAHDILICVEKVMKFLKDSKAMFENDRGQNTVTKATAEYQKFKCPDNKEWELKYFGPTGYGSQGKPIGCQNFFTAIGFTKLHVENLSLQANHFEKYMSSKRGSGEASQKRSKLADRTVKFINTLCTAFRLSEHYYISSVVSANGNLDFSTGNEEWLNSRFKKKPKKIIENLHRRVCNHGFCNAPHQRGRISHDTFFDGSTPQWESSIVINLLTPGVLMRYLSKHTRSLVFASGSLAPIPSLCSELNLLPPDPKHSATKMPQAVEKVTQKDEDDSFNSMGIDEVEEESKFIDPFAEKFGRLQVAPKPLEASHVIDLNRQLLSIGIGHFPDGSPLSVKMANYSKAGFHEKLGDAIATLIEAIPQGGVLGEHVFGCIVIKLD